MPDLQWFWRNLVITTFNLVITTFYYFFNSLYLTLLAFRKFSLNNTSYYAVYDCLMTRCFILLNYMIILCHYMLILYNYMMIYTLSIWWYLIIDFLYARLSVCPGLVGQTVLSTGSYLISMERKVTTGFQGRRSKVKVVLSQSRKTWQDTL